MLNIVTSVARNVDESEPEGRTESINIKLAELCLQSGACEYRSEGSELAKSPSEERAAREAAFWSTVGFLAESSEAKRKRSC